MATTFDAILRIGARVDGASDIRALSAAVRQVADETKQVAALERAQISVARANLEIQSAAAKTERDRLAIVSERLQLSTRAAQSEYAATLKQLAAQKELQAAQVKAAAERVRASEAAIKQSLVLTDAIRSENTAAKDNLRFQLEKARAQYQSINNAKQIATLEREAAIATAQGTAAARQRAEVSAQKARVDAATFAAFRAADQQAAQQAQQRAQADAAARQQTIAGMQSIRNMAVGAAAALGIVGSVQIAGNIIQAGQEAELTRRRIVAVAGELGEVGGVYQIAAKASQQFALGNTEAQTAVASLYNRLRPMGITLGEIETVFMGVNKAAMMGGLTAYDASEAFRQLGQAMGSGRLQGDELRSLMERMPAIGQAVARVMGVTVGEIKQLGADGKITTDILVKAAGELAKLQPPEPTALQRYQAAIKDLATAVGEELLPTLTPAIQGLTTLVNVAASKVGGLMDVLNAYGVAVQKVMALTMGVIRGEPEVAMAIWQELDRLAEEAAVAAANRKLMEEGATDAARGYNDQLRVAKQSSAEIAAEKQRQKELEDQITAAMQQQNAQSDLQYQQAVNINDVATARINERRDAAQNILSVEQAQIGVARAILNQKMSIAQTEGERQQIAQQIANLELQSAQANYRAIMAQIDAEIELERIRVINAENEFRRAQAAYNIAVQYGKLTADIEARRDRARSDLMVAAVENRAFDTSVAARRQVAGLNLQASTIQAAPVQSTIAPGGNYLEINGQVISGTSAFAKGGHVNGPTVALIGEGGEGESVVPDSKRYGFAMNVLAGKTGAAAIPGLTNAPYVQKGPIPAFIDGAYTSSLPGRNRIDRPQGYWTTDGIWQRYEQIPTMGVDTDFRQMWKENETIRRRNAERLAYFRNPENRRQSVSIKVEPRMTPMPDGQMWMPQTEVEKMALQIAQQVTASNNRQQRQPTARRTAARR